MEEGEIGEESNIIIEEEKHENNKEIIKEESLLSQWTKPITTTDTIKEYLLNILALCKSHMNESEGEEGNIKLEKNFENINNKDYILGSLVFCILENKINSERMKFTLFKIAELYIKTESTYNVWYNLPFYQWKSKDYAQFLCAFLITFYNPSIDYIPNKEDDYNKKSLEEKRTTYWLSSIEGGLVLQYLHNNNNSLKSFLNELWESRFSLLKDNNSIINREGKPISRKEFNLNWDKCKFTTFIQILNLLLIVGRNLCSKTAENEEYKNIITECMMKENAQLLSKGLKINIILSEMIIIFNKNKIQYITDIMNNELLLNNDNNEDDDEDEYNRDNPIDKQYEKELLEAKEELSLLNNNNNNNENKEVIEIEGEVKSESKNLIGESDKEETPIKRKKLFARRIKLDK